MKRLGLSLAITAALGLSACGGGSSSSNSGGETSSTVSGTASKGIIIGGLVSAYLFDESGAPASTAIATAITDSKGTYTLTIPAVDKGKPLYIAISNNAAAGDAATMKCDISGGCGGDVAFGDAYTLANNFSLGAVLPAAGGEVSVNLTPFTTAAAKKALDSIENVGGGAGIANLISNANSSVANTLNDILGTSLASVTDIEVIDLTDTAAVAAAIASGNIVEVKVAALNAAIVSAVQADNDGFSIEEAIEEFTEDLSNTALVGNSSDNAITDVAEILQAAEDVLAEVINDATDAGVGSDALTILTNEVQELQDDAAAPEETDVAVDDEPAPTAGSANLDKVKAFVEELRELGTVIDSKVVKDGGTDTVEVILDNFDLQIDAADMASSDDAEAAMEALGSAVAAIVDVYDNNFDMGTGLPTEASALTVFPATVVSEEESLSVIISKSGDVFTFRVNETIAVEMDDDGETSSPIEAIAKAAAIIEAVAETTIINADVDVSAVINVLTVVEVETESTTGSIVTETGSLDASVDINLSGSVSTPTIDLTVSNGIVKGTADVAWTETEDFAHLLTTGYLETGTTFTVADIENVQELVFNSEGTGTIRFAPNADNGNNENDVNSITWSVSAAGVLEFTETDGGNDSWDWVFTPSLVAPDQLLFSYTVNEVGTSDSDSGTGKIVSTQGDIYVNVSSDETSDATFDLSGFEFDLDVILSQKASESITDPLTFTGGLDFTISSVGFIEDEEEQTDFSGSPEELDVASYSLGLVGFGIKGTFANTQNESFAMDFSIEADASNVPSLSETFVNRDKTSTTGGETESQYVAAKVSLTFDAKLDGYENAITFSFDIERTAYDDIDASVRLSYPGNVINIVADANNLDEEGEGEAVITLSNNADVVMTVMVNEVVDGSDEVSAKMMVNNDDTVYAELAEVNGIDIIRYSDGTFVSAF